MTLFRVNPFFKILRSKAESIESSTAGRFIHRKIIVRLFWGWLFLSTIIGGGILYTEMQRVEGLVHELALKESATVSKESAYRIEHLNVESTKYLNQLAEQLIGQNFLVVEVYDRNKELKLGAVRKGNDLVAQRIDQYRHKFPQNNSFSHELHIIDRQLWLVIFVPLKPSERETPIGYFEAVYQVDPGTLDTIKHDVLRSLIYVILGNFCTTLLMYPTVLTLNRSVMKLASELLQGNMELLNVLGCAIAERDSDTNSHNYRVTYYALRLGATIGLSDENLRQLIAGSFLHDVGKIGIRDFILLKPEKLTSDEFEIMKTHVSLGVQVVSKSSWLKGASDVVQFHHEKYDGTGYPKGLKEKEIPINARIFAIVDVFDALTSKRPYKTSWPMNQAVESLKKESGTHFDPELLTIFLGIVDDLQQEMNELEAHNLEAAVQSIISSYFLKTH